MELLDTLLFECDFMKEMGRLDSILAELGLPHVHQLGVVVADAEAAARDLEDKGLPPFFIAAGKVPKWIEGGRERSFAGKLGLATYRGVEIELLEPGTGSDFYRQHLHGEGRPIIQHLGVIVPDAELSARNLEALGIPRMIRGAVKAGPIRGEFAYLDAIDRTGFIVEPISYRIFGRSAKPARRIPALLGRLQKRTGIRSFSV